MSVHYKFKSALDYDTVTFDGLHISVGDLKAAISQQKRIGKTSDFDLEITNAQTKEVYIDDATLIPKNTSLLVARVPLSQQPKKQWDGSSNNAALHKEVLVNKGLADLSRMEGSEQDKINAMISQSTFDYDPSNYQKIRAQNQRGVVPSNYICYKCQKYGHWIKDCPTANSSDPIEIRRSTGIPRSFMVPVDGPKAPGAMMTPSGTFAVPAVDHEAYLASESAVGADTPANAPAAPEPTIPDELICSLCRDLLTDAVMIPCCGNSFCDECIRGALLESEDHECPDCREKEIAPTTLIPNRFLRNSVSSFRNQTGYSRRAPHRPAAAPPHLVNMSTEQPPPVVPLQPPPNGPPPPIANNDVGRWSSDGSSDNITVLVPPRYTHRRRRDRDRGREPRRDRHGPPGLKPPGMETPPNMPMNVPRGDEQRASTPTIDEGRDPMASQGSFNRGGRPPFVPGVPPPGHRFNNPGAGPGYGRGRRLGAPFVRFPPEPYQPPPPGIKDEPNGHGEDPLEAFNRMIREKEMRAARREVSRRRGPSGSPPPRSRSPPPRSRSPPPRSRSPPPRSRSPPPRSRSPRSPRSPPPRRSPSPRRPLRPPSRHRYSRSRSISRGRLRRSPWSPRRRRTRDRSLSLTRSPSPRRRHRSPMRYRSPLRSPLRSPPRSPLRSPPRSPHRTPHRSPHCTPHRSPHRSPMRSPRRSALRSPPPRAMSPHRYPGLYDELLSPPRRNVEPPYGPRFGSRNNGPPPMYPNMGVKPIPPLSSIQIQEPPPGYRGRFDAPPFEDIPPGLEPPVPGFEPSPFEKPPFVPPGPIDRDRMQPSNYRDPYRAPFVEGPPGYNAPNEIPVHVGDLPRYRDNYRPGHPYRDQGPMPYRDGQPFRDVGPPGSYREPGFRGGPPAPFRENYRNAPFREGGFRDNPPHGFREGPVPFRPPSVDPREPPPANYHDPAFRDGFRDENNPGRDMRPGYRAGVRNRGPSRRNPNFEQDRHREPDGRDRERYAEIRDPAERARDMEKRSGYEKGRDNREGREDRLREDRPREDRSRGDRPRDHDRNREFEKDREREHEKGTPEKKIRGSPKRSRDTREKRRSESRGRSRDHDRDGKREKKEERIRDKTSSERAKEHKEKEKKLRDKERKKKKREKEKDTDKKKKREKKDKKDKEIVKKEEDESDKTESKDDKTNELNEEDAENVADEIKTSNEDAERNIEEKLESPKREVKDEPQNDLYGDEPAEAIDKEIIQNYVKNEQNKGLKEEVTDSSVDPALKEEPFDGIELQVTADELDLKTDIESTTEKEMLAPLPELSKWEVDDDNAEKKEPGEITSPEEEDSGKVTSEVLKRAENAIFAKAINSLRPIEIKKISSDRLKLYDDATQAKGSMNNIQITVPVADPEHRSIEINDKNKKRTSKTPPPRLSVKERLGGKVDDVRRSREPRVVHSTVERVKSRSKTPNKDKVYRRVTVDRDRSKKHDPLNRMDQPKGEKPRLIAEARVLQEKFSSRSPNRDKKRKDLEKSGKDPKKVRSDTGIDSRSQDKSVIDKTTIERERKKSTLDEAHFEPDYDETVESDHEGKDEAASKKRERSLSQTVTSEVKKPKLEEETIKLDLSNVKKKPETETESSSDSETSSSSSSDTRKRKKKKKRSNKKKKKRAASDSESDSDSDSDDHKKKKKRRKHKKKSSKKKKKSKHK